LVFIVVSTGLTWAQDRRAGIRGVVTGPDRKPIPGIQVVATQPETGVRQTARTGADGSYTLRRLPTRSTRVTVAHKGYQRIERKVDLTAGQPYELPLTLEPLAPGETLTSEIRERIDARKIEDMPLGDRRSMNMIGIAGASVFVNYESGQKPNFSLGGGWWLGPRLGSHPPVRRSLHGQHGGQYDQCLFGRAAARRCAPRSEPYAGRSHPHALVRYLCFRAAGTIPIR
jgi:hypothetical protein